VSIGREFIEKTKYPHLGPSPQEKGVPQPAVCDTASVFSRVIALPPPAVTACDLASAISARRSLRRYGAQPLSLGELSFLLWCTQGVRQVTPGATFRTVPSAGSRHCFETIVFAHRVEGLDEGFFQFLAADRALGALPARPDAAESLCAACLGQGFVQSAAAVFIWVAVVERMTWRYGERGYRYLFLDAGHICQNLYLAAEAVGCGACAIGAFSDDDMNLLLGLDGTRRCAVYAAAVGKKP